MMAILWSQLPTANTLQLGIPGHTNGWLDKPLHKLDIPSRSTHMYVYVTNIDKRTTKEGDVNSPLASNEDIKNVSDKSRYATECRDNYFPLSRIH